MTRSLRAGAAGFALLAAVSLVSCGGTEGPSQAELAAQDRKVIAIEQRQQAHQRLVQAVRAKARALRAQKRAAALARGERSGGTG